MGARLKAIERTSAWAVAVTGGWLGYRLLMQIGQLLLRIEELEKRLAQLTGHPTDDTPAPTGLPVGSAFHDFALPTLSGDTVALSDWRGQDVLLIFFDPECEFCRHMLPELARLETQPQDGRPIPVIVSTGDADANRRLMESHDVRLPVLLQKRNEVAKLCWVDGTPMGYLLDERGAVARPLAVGSLAIMKLAHARSPDGTDAAEPAMRYEHGYTPYPSLTFRRFDREGLPAGTTAPDFRLPRVDGGELSLTELRGQPVLLVFSDPECQPCNELAPELESIHRREPDLSMLVVSRGEVEANRRWIAEHELTVPVVLQRQWEISRTFRVLATPVAFLIDDSGVISADVAVGLHEILALAGKPAAPASRGREEVVSPV